MITINFEGSQAILDALVTSIYMRKAIVKAENVVEVLALADFLQVCPHMLPYPCLPWNVLILSLPPVNRVGSSSSANDNVAVFKAGRLSLNIGDPFGFLHLVLAL